MKVKIYGKYLLWYSFFSFVIFATWEWVQTPLFIDMTKDLNRIVWNRIHCTIGDMMILIFCLMGTSILFRRLDWLFEPKFPQLLSVSLMGVAYTIFSEYRNVYRVKSWDYSEYMPTVLGIGIGPIIQWMLLPSLILYILKRFMQTDRGYITV